MYILYNYLYLSYRSDDDKNEILRRYELIAYAIHLGAEYGHYVARVSRMVESRRQWFFFDDDRAIANVDAYNTKFKTEWEGRTIQLLFYQRDYSYDPMTSY